MEKFKPKLLNLSQINGGNKFNIGDGVTTAAINAPIESAAFTQSLVTNSPNISEIDTEGTPSASIEYMADGSPRFVFKHLKGKKGESGLDYGATLSNEYGSSEINGYTQLMTNSLVYKPNLLINGDFKVWQRGTYFSSTGFKRYTADRWLVVSTDGSATTTVKYQQTDEGKGIGLSLDSTATAYLQYYMESTDIDKLIGEKVSLVCCKNKELSVYQFFVDNSHKNLLFQLPLYDGDVVNWVKLEVGEPTKFVPRNYSEELLLCQRYYQTFNPNNSADDLRFLVLWFEPNVADGGFQPPVEMRVSPTATVSEVSYYDYSQNTWVDIGNNFYTTTTYKNQKQFWIQIVTYNISHTRGSMNSVRLKLVLDAEIYGGF